MRCPLCGALSVVMVALLILSLPSCGRESLYTATYLDVFDTVLTITVPAPDRATAETHITAIHELLTDIHRDLDIYHRYDGRTNLCDVNAAAGGEALTVSHTILDVLTLGKTYYDRTDGRINICLGAVLRLWQEARSAGDRLPDPDALASAMTDATSIDALAIDPTNATVRITDPSVSVDVGAIAKGYAMSCVQAYADETGLDAVLVNLGGHVWARGLHADGHAWTVTVRDPLSAATPGRILEATDLSVVTSGDYERTFTVDGKAYHHIIDPATGYPADRYHAVTVTVPLTHTVEADALSTALFLMDIESGARLLSTIPGATAIWTAADGTVTESSALLLS